MPARPAGFTTQAIRFAGRYVIATVMIPVGVALGVGGLVQFAIKRMLERPGRA